MSHTNLFPRSLAAIGLSPGFTHEQFCCMMEFERSDEIRQLAHQEWSNLQGEEYENSPYRWYLSYASMKTQYAKDMGYACLLYTSPSPRDLSTSRMPSSA